MRHAVIHVPDTSVPTNMPRKAADDPSSTVLAPMWETKIKILVWAWFSPGCCSSHSGGEPADGKFIHSLTLSFPPRTPTAPSPPPYPVHVLCIWVTLPFKCKKVLSKRL